MAMVGWINRQQQDAIEYLRTENRILREKLGTKRIILDDSQKRCLAVRYVISSYADHYNTERPHKALNYRRPMEPDTPPPRDGPIKCHERLGGLLKGYYREAA